MVVDTVAGRVSTLQVLALLARVTAHPHIDAR